MTKDKIRGSINLPVLIITGICTTFFTIIVVNGAKKISFIGDYAENPVFVTLSFIIGFILTMITAIILMGIGSGILYLYDLIFPGSKDKEEDNEESRDIEDTGIEDLNKKKLE